MRDIDPAMMAALENAPIDGLVPRQLIWFTVKDRATGAADGIGVWSGDENLAIDVYSGVDGSLVSRPYVGGGAFLRVSDIPRVSDFTVQSVTIDLSQLADTAQAIVREYEARLGKVEIHELLLDPKTGDPVSPGAIVFLGEIDGAPIKTPRFGEEGQIEIKIVSDVMSMLTRTNYRKSSYEGQKLRQDDEWGKDSSIVKTWKVSWGADAT